MLLRQINISQVKCNFCMQWTTLNTQVRFNINVCDQCLTQGCEQNNLRAVSSRGQLYQLYMVKQNSIIESVNIQRTACNWFQTKIDQKTDIQNDQNQRTQFLQQIDEYRNTEIRDILGKWNILTSFLIQKQTLSNQQIEYLKTLCTQKNSDFKKFNQDFTIQLLQTNQKQAQKEFINESTQQHMDDCNVNYEIKIQFPIKKRMFQKPQIQDKQNFWSTQQKSTLLLKNKMNNEKQYVFNSPKAIGLKEKDLNCLHVSLCKLSDLKQNNTTYDQRVNTSFFDDSSSLGSSSVKNSIYLAQRSIRSSRANSILNGLTKRLNNQQVKKFEQIKNRIARYLEKNYESNSPSRLMFSVVFQAYENTSLAGKSLQLVSYNLSFTDFKCYLEAFDWTGVQVLKLVKTKLSDEQFKILIDFIVFNKLSIKVLVLTSNKLTETSIEHLFDQTLDSVKQIYLGKNRIMKGKVRNKVTALQNKYSLYL